MELLDKAQQWADHDPDSATASSLNADIEAARGGDEEALARVGAAMNGPLEFGTAGLRGVVGPGESRMNLAVVIRATAGLCDVVKRHATGTPTLVVGCDARYGIDPTLNRNRMNVTMITTSKEEGGTIEVYRNIHDFSLNKGNAIFHLSSDKIYMNSQRFEWISADGERIPNVIYRGDWTPGTVAARLQR